MDLLNLFLSLQFRSVELTLALALTVAVLRIIGQMKSAPFVLDLFTTVRSIFWFVSRERLEKSPLDLIPGPRSFPVIGAALSYCRPFGQLSAFAKGKYHLAHEYFLRRYGTVVRENVRWAFPLIHLFDRKDIEAVLRSPGDYPLRPPNMADVFYREQRPELYSDLGVVNLNGEGWHRLRQLLTPPLTNRNTPKHYAGHMNLIADDFVSLVGEISRKSGGVLNGFKDLVYRAGLETVSNVALERRMGFLDSSDLSGDTKLILDAIQGSQSASNDAMYGYSLLFSKMPIWCSTALTSLCRHRDNLCRAVGNIVDATISGDSEEKETDGEETSILRQLLKNPELSQKDVKASVIDYITAGVDTIGNSIIFALGLVAKHAEVQRKLQEELERVLVRGEDITAEKILDLKYLRACVNESFRLCPTASQIARITTEDMWVGDGEKYFLPKYSVVLCHSRVACLQESNFTRAAEFLPERWMEGKCGDFENFEPGMVMPFGFGKRICPGKRLAEQEIYIIVAKLFLEYNVSLIDDLEMEFNWLLTPGTGPMRLRVEERSSGNN